MRSVQGEMIVLHSPGFSYFFFISFWLFSTVYALFLDCTGGEGGTSFFVLTVHVVFDVS